MITPMNEKYYTMKQVAERFGVSYGTIQRWRKQGILQFTKKKGGKKGAVRISQTQIELFMQTEYGNYKLVKKDNV